MARTCAVFFATALNDSACPALIAAQRGPLEPALALQIEAEDWMRSQLADAYKRSGLIRLDRIELQIDAVGRCHREGIQQTANLLQRLSPLLEPAVAVPELARLREIQARHLRQNGTRPAALAS